MKSKITSLLAIVAIGCYGAAFAQGYDDDDIYYNPSKSKSTKEATTATPVKQYNNTVTEFPSADTYTVTPGQGVNIDVDTYNRRGAFAVDTVNTKTNGNKSVSNFECTQQIERFYNPRVIIESTDDDIARYYYAEPATDINIYINTPGYWGSSIYSPYYYGSPWYWGTPRSWWYYNSWAWNTSWGWGWDPYWSWGWGGYYPGYWGPSYHPVRPGWTNRPSGNTRPGYRPGGSGHGNSRPGYRGGNSYGTSRPSGTTAPAYRPGSSGHGSSSSGYRSGRSSNRSNSSPSYRDNSGSNRSSSSPSYRSGSGSHRSSGGSYGGSRGGGSSRGGGGGRGRH